MSDVALRPRSATEMVDAAFQLYRRNFVPFVLVTGAVYVPWLFVRLLLLDVVRSTTSLALVAPILWLGLSLAYWLMTATVLKLGAEAYLGESVDLPGAVREVLPRVGPLLVAGFLVGLLFLLGSLALFVGALYVVARYFAVPAAIVLERTGPVEAMGRSTALANGRKWHILGTLALVWVIYMALAFAIGMLGVALGTLGTAVISTVFTIVAYPVVGLTQLVLYYDARIRAEAFDVEIMTEGLDSAQPSTS